MEGPAYPRRYRVFAYDVPRTGHSCEMHQFVVLAYSMEEADRQFRASHYGMNMSLVRILPYIGGATEEALYRQDCIVPLTMPLAGHEESECA